MLVLVGAGVVVCAMVEVASTSFLPFSLQTVGAVGRDENDVRQRERELQSVKEEQRVRKLLVIMFLGTNEQRAQGRTEGAKITRHRFFLVSVRTSTISIQQLFPTYLSRRS